MAFNYDVILMMGPQGSGKGTQGKRLAAKLNFFYWEMGAVLRGVIAEGGSLAERVSVLNNGTLLSDELLIEVIKERLSAIPSDKGIIFDGVPRRIGQAEFLFCWLKEQHRDRVATLFISLPREESVKRLMLRAQTEKRADDTPEGIERRLQFYETETAPILDYIKKKTTYFEVDGTPTIDEVEKEINAALGI
jgi:adenylate kinase